MIDHVSIAVRDLAAAARFYEPVLATLGMTKLREWPDAAIGFGKGYPEFWLNKRSGMTPVPDDSGAHICLRAREPAAVEAFFAAGIAAGGASDGAPGFRTHYSNGYYAAFIRDPDGNRIEAVTFAKDKT
jgi:catechol 2,3-dioxygenase-like lactoylglutathione lyase family enzyme